jgi:hypothetical protein
VRPWALRRHSRATDATPGQLEDHTFS